MRKTKLFLLLIFEFFFGYLILSSSSKDPIPLYQDTSDILQGHSRECFSFAILSFESCKQIFLKLNCSHLKYQNKVCSLHNKDLKDFQQLLTHVTETIILTKSKETTTAVVMPNLGISATRKYQKCIRQLGKIT